MFSNLLLGTCLIWKVMPCDIDSMYVFLVNLKRMQNWHQFGFISFWGHKIGIFRSLGTIFCLGQ